MGGKGGPGSSPDVVYVVLERSSAMDLLNALYIALGITPKGGTEGQGDGGTLGSKGGGGGVKEDIAVKPGAGKGELVGKGGSKSGGSKSGGGKSGGKPKGVKAGGSKGAGKGK